jgi:flagellar assembly protein FliH
MGQVLPLEDFAGEGSSGPFVANSSDQKDHEKVGFDKGYKAGWDDAVAEARDQDMQARANCATALQEIDFTYFEARQHVTSSFKPLIEAIIGAILPEAAQHALAPLVVEEIQKLTKLSDTPITILCAPDACAELSTLVETFAKGPVTVRGEDSLAATQVQLHFDGGLSEINVDAAVSAIRDTIQAHFAPAGEEQHSYG